MWLYVSRILVQRQRHEAATYGIPRGNLSDLYPVWLGSRELLLNGRNPYSQEVTREIQTGFYGRELEPSNRYDPTNQQAFAYPVYVTFLLAPTVKMPFAEVRTLFSWFLALVTAVSVLLWLSVLRWEPVCSTTVLLILFTLASFPAIQGIRIQQLTLLVAALIAACLALLVRSQFVLSGLLLAVATIKPQLALPLAGWLLLWALTDLRNRWRFIVSFLTCVGLLVAGGEFLLQGWIAKFLTELNAYLQYAAAGSLLQELLTHNVGLAAAAMIVCATVIACWRGRTANERDSRFVRLSSLVLAVTVSIVPMFPPNYQLLLLPGALLLVQHRQQLWAANFTTRVLLLISGAFLFWQWASAGVLLIAYFLGFAAERFAALPLWTNMLFPIPLTACLVLAALSRKTVPATAET